MATTVLVSRQVVGGSFVSPAPLRKSESLDTPVLAQHPAPRTARAAARLAGPDDDENPTVLASVAPEADLALTVETAASSATPAFARKAVAQCKYTYGTNTQSRQSVVEFHNAANSRGRWVYGQSADSDIEGGIKYPGKNWSINGSAHVSNSRSLSVSLSYGDRANNYGRSDFLVRHWTITTLDGSDTPAGGQCYGYPSDLTIGTKGSSAFQWVGGAVDNYTLAGAEFIGCSNSPQSLHRTAYNPGSTFSRVDGNAAKISAAGDLGPLWVGAKSGFSTDMELHYDNITGSGIWLCGTNYYPNSAGVIHAENR
jgi:hypothetical protein